MYKGYYSYDNFNYTGYNKVSTIHCLLHGDFEESPKNHLSFNGCKSVTAQVSNLLVISY